MRPVYNQTVLFKNTPEEHAQQSTFVIIFSTHSFAAADLIYIENSQESFKETFRLHTFLFNPRPAGGPGQK